MVKYVLLRGKSGGWSTFGGIKSAPVEISILSGALLRLLSRPSRISEPKMSSNTPKRGQLVRGRIQSGLPLTSGANPSCPADCQYHGTRAPKATFSDIAKYMILQCVFRVFRTFWGVKSAPGEKRNFPRGPF